MQTACEMSSHAMRPAFRALSHRASSQACPVYFTIQSPTLHRKQLPGCGCRMTTEWAASDRLGQMLALHLFLPAKALGGGPVGHIL